MTAPLFPQSNLTRIGSIEGRTGSLERRPEQLSTALVTSTAFMSWTSVTALAAAGDTRFLGLTTTHTFETNDAVRFPGVGASASGTDMMLVYGADLTIRMVARVYYHSPHRVGSFFLSIYADNVPPNGSIGIPLGESGAQNCIQRATSIGSHQIVQEVSLDFYGNVAFQWAACPRIENTALTGGTQTIDQVTLTAWTLGPQVA